MLSNNNKIKRFSLLISALSLTLFAPHTFAAKPQMEKCAGIVKAGKADGHTVVNGKKVDWILVPAGACLKLVGGKVILDKKK